MGLSGRRGLVCALAIASLLGARGGSASVSIAVPLDDLVRDSQAAAIVTPVSQTSMWQDGRIFTYTEAHVDTRVAGSGLDDEVWVRTLGGEVGHVGQQVEGEAVLTVGRPSLLFLRAAHVLDGTTEPVAEPGAYSVTDRGQGQFPVVLDAAGNLRVRKSASAGALMAPRAPSGRMAADVLHGLEVSAATSAVGQAWKRVHGT